MADPEKHEPSDENLEDGDLTYRIRGAVFEVSRELGAGFLEKVYENALAKELRMRGCLVEQQRSIAVRYKNEIVGDYFADLVVEGRILIEVKAATLLRPEHEAQLLHYLKATGIRLGLLVNFTHPKAQIKRYVL
jgi:GxxExxY protein